MLKKVSRKLFGSIINRKDQSNDLASFQKNTNNHNSDSSDSAITTDTTTTTLLAIKCLESVAAVGIETYSIEELCERYIKRSQEEDIPMNYEQITVSGLVQFCYDIQCVPKNDVSVLVVFYHLLLLVNEDHTKQNFENDNEPATKKKQKNCLEHPYMVSKQQFLEGWQRFDCKNLKDIKNRVRIWREEWEKCANRSIEIGGKNLDVPGDGSGGSSSNDDRQQHRPESLFHDVYKFAFDFNVGVSLDSEDENDGFETIEDAIAGWDLFFRNRWPLYQQWVQFAKQRYGSQVVNNTASSSPMSPPEPTSTASAEQMEEEQGGGAREGKEEEQETEYNEKEQEVIQEVSLKEVTMTANDHITITRDIWQSFYSFVIEYWTTEQLLDFKEDDREWPVMILEFVQSVVSALAAPQQEPEQETTKEHESEENCESSLTQEAEILPKEDTHEQSHEQEKEVHQVQQPEANVL